MQYLEDLFGLREKTAIVSGGAGVIGTVLSQALANAGAKVAIWSRSQASIDKILSKMSLPSDRLMGLKVDTGNESEVFYAVKQTAATLGPPEILINAVGGNMDKSAFIDIDLDKFEKILHLNLVAGLVVPTKIVTKFWIEKKIKGAIINLTSMTSYTPLSGVWAYNAAKSGVLRLTEACANEFAGHGIRVNAIAPGFFIGKQNRALLIDANTGELTDRGKSIIARTPIGRFGDPAELAGTTLFLASNKAAGFVTGVSIPVDGGYLCHNI
jgi:NAD(P)-dependent dehydrogenase (short-subunit alcohol dehydrogenase family)